MMNIGNSKGMSKRRTSSQFISSQNSGGSFGDGESECSVMSSGGCFEKLGDSLGVSSFSSDREAINEQCLLSSQGRATQEVRKSHSVDLYEKMQNKRKLCTAGNSPKTLLSDLSKFSSEETKKTESSPESHKIKKNGLCEDSSFIDTSQRVAEKKDNEISNPMFESALDEYEAAFDICFDDDCQELFDCNIEERAINDPKNPKKDCSSDENISDSSLETFPVVKNCKKLVDDSSNVKKYSERFGKIDGHCNKLINNSICSPIKQNDCTSKKNDGIGQGTLQTSNRMCQKSVPEVFTPTTMTQLLSSPGNITSNESMVQRYCSSPKERQSSKPPSMLQNLSPNLSSPIVRSCDARSSENSVSKIRKRKFPGPAGMLPDIPPGTDLFALKRTEFMNKNIFSDWYYENKICSQEIFEHFEKPPWQNMLKDLATHSDPSLLKRFNIRSAMLKTSKMRLPKHIVLPVMCVLLSDLKFNSIEANAVFTDETGQIAGKICVEVIEKYKEYMVPFSVLIIKRAAFLCNHLIVKLENVAAIYSANGKNLRLEGTSSENIKMLEDSNSSSKKNIIQRPEHQNPGVAIDDDYESFFADDMDDLLNSMDDDASKINF